MLSLSASAMHRSGLNRRAVLSAARDRPRERPFQVTARGRATLERTKWESVVSPCNRSEWHRISMSTVYRGMRRHHGRDTTVQRGETLGPRAPGTMRAHWDLSLLSHT